MEGGTANTPPRQPFASTGKIANFRESPIIAAMSTVAEIEAAIEKLSPQEQRELAAWYEERQALLNGADALFQVYDREESGT